MTMLAMFQAPAQGCQLALCLCAEPQQPYDSERRRTYQRRPVAAQLRRDHDAGPDGHFDQYGQLDHQLSSAECGCRDRHAFPAQAGLFAPCWSTTG